MFQKIRYFIVLSFICVFTALDITYAMPTTQKNYLEFELDGTEDSVPDKEDWKSLESEHEALIESGFSCDGNEEGYSPVDHFISTLDGMMSHMGVGNEFEIAGIWPLCTRCLVFLPSYLYALKTRCLLAKVQNLITQDDLSNWQEPSEWLSKAEVFIDSANKFTEYCRKGRAVIFKDNDLLIYLTDMHYRCLQRKIAMKRGETSHKKLELDVHKLAAIKKYNYENEYFESFRGFIPEKYMNTMGKIAEGEAAENSKKSRRPAKKGKGKKK